MEDYIILLLIPAFAMVAAEYHKGRQAMEDRDLWKDRYTMLASRTAHNDGRWKRRHHALREKYRTDVMKRRAREKRRR